MEKSEIEKQLKENGFEIVKETIWNPISESYIHCNIWKNARNEDDWEFCQVNFDINDNSLYVNERRYAQIETNDNHLIVRMYCEGYYVGCIIENYDNITYFDIHS